MQQRTPHTLHPRVLKATNHLSWGLVRHQSVLFHHRNLFATMAINLPLNQHPKVQPALPSQEPSLYVHIHPKPHRHSGERPSPLLLAKNPQPSTPSHAPLRLSPIQHLSPFTTGKRLVKDDDACHHSRETHTEAKWCELRPRVPRRRRLAVWERGKGVYMSCCKCMGGCRSSGFY